jgi:hypothetical protein
MHPSANKNGRAGPRNYRPPPPGIRGPTQSASSRPAHREVSVAGGAPWTWVASTASLCPTPPPRTWMAQPPSASPPGCTPRPACTSCSSAPSAPTPCSRRFTRSLFTHITSFYFISRWGSGWDANSIPSFFSVTIALFVITALPHQ